MRALIREHGADDRVTEVVVTGVTCKVREQMLCRVVDVFLRGDQPPIIGTILLCALLEYLGGREDSAAGQQVEPVWSHGLLAAAFIGDGGRVFPDACDQLTHFASLLLISCCRMRSRAVS